MLNREEEHSMKTGTRTREFKDFTAEEYKAMVCTSYTGGASWLRSKAHNAFFVVACTPIEILKYFREHPDSTVRGEFIPFDSLAGYGVKG